MDANQVINAIEYRISEMPEDWLTARQALQEVADLIRSAPPRIDSKPAHPWLAYLSTRAAVIDWKHQDGDSDEAIAAQLSMDAAQVSLIRTRDRTTDLPVKCVRTCVCGEPGTAGVKHRTDGPCYVSEFP